MIALIQITHHMIHISGFSPDEVSSYYAMIQRGQIKIDDLCVSLGLQVNPLGLRIAEQKFDRWPSVLEFVQLKGG